MPATTHAAGTTAAEAEALAEIEAAVAAGKDPFGDDDDGNSSDVALNADDGTSDDAADGDALTPEQLVAIVGDDDDAATTDAAAAPDSADASDTTAAADATNEGTTESEAPRYETQTPQQLSDAKKDLRAKKAKAFKDYTDGVIDADEFSSIDDEVADALEQLTVQRTLHTANVQSELEKQGAVLGDIIAAAKESGLIDYTADAAASTQFDLAMQMLAADGKRRSYAQLAQAAHKQVLAARGIAAPVASKEETKPAPATTRENGKGPVTLRHIPAAATPNAGGDWRDRLAQLSGQSYEDAFAGLTPAQRESLLND